ncbi:hypothetical protein J6590_054122 [Homalodisca vitripennis]|nr:hypothetical protein J6590_054122 [Homalodisca vitripennis]
MSVFRRIIKGMLVRRSLSVNTSGFFEQRSPNSVLAYWLSSSHVSHFECGIPSLVYSVYYSDAVGDDIRHRQKQNNLLVGFLQEGEEQGRNFKRDWKRLPVVSDCSPQTGRVSSAHPGSSSMAVSRVPSPPPPEVNTPVAENWCYTQTVEYARTLVCVCVYVYETCATPQRDDRNASLHVDLFMHNYTLFRLRTGWGGSATVMRQLRAAVVNALICSQAQVPYSVLYTVVVIRWVFTRRSSPSRPSGKLYLISASVPVFGARSRRSSRGGWVPVVSCTAAPCRCDLSGRLVAMASTNPLDADIAATRLPARSPTGYCVGTVVTGEMVSAIYRLRLRFVDQWYCTVLGGCVQGRFKQRDDRVRGACIYRSLTPSYSDPRYDLPRCHLANDLRPAQRYLPGNCCQLVDRVDASYKVPQLDRVMPRARHNTASPGPTWTYVTSKVECGVATCTVTLRRIDARPRSPRGSHKSATLARALHLA